MFRKIESLLIFLSFFLINAQGQKQCDNSFCHFEAPCILKDDSPTCECVKQFFEGDFCSTPVQYCTPNPCQNGGTCRTFPGHPSCNCANGFSGKTCTSQQDVFKGLHLHYNHIAPIGSQQSLMFTLETLGTVETLMEFYTQEYIIDGIIFTSESGHFKKSNNLVAEGNSLEIKHSAELPYKEGFYRIAKAAYWKLGLNSMTLHMSALEGEAFFSGNFDIFVYDPTDSECFPEIHIPHCSNPRKPLHLDIQSFAFIEPIITKRCYPNSDFNVIWSVRNYVNSVVLHKFNKQTSLALTIPAFTMWFNYRDDFLQSYLIQGEVVETDHKDIHKSKTVLRCYVFVDSKPVLAVILGGPDREVNFNKQVFLDGSDSRDYAKARDQYQELEYSWSCESGGDAENPFCKQSMSTDNRLVIPPKKLKLGETYKFSLLVRSSINIFSTDEAFQAIKVVSEDPLLIHFTCLRNCEHGKFAANKLIHLKLDCIECPSGDIAYSVQNALGTEISTTQQVILTETGTEVSLKADATLGSLKGSTSIKLTLNPPPQSGTCSITPLSGVEYQTLFTITCSGYDDKDHTIDYKFCLGETVLDHEGGNVLVTRLYPTSGQVCDIRISVCDGLGACTEIKLQVTLQPIVNPVGSWTQFLSQDDSNLRELIESEDRSSAFVLISIVARQMSAAESKEVVKHVVGALNNINANRLLEAEQFLAIANNFFHKTEVTHETASLISEFYIKVAIGLSNSMKNKEVLELQLETHEIMLMNLAQAINHTSIEIEEFPLVHNAEPLPPENLSLENVYPDYGELNVEDVVHMADWLKSFQRLHKCLQVMGVVSAFVQLPEEPPVVIKTKGVSSMTLAYDKASSPSLDFNESDTFVDIPKELLQDVCGDELAAVQITVFTSNPLWWAPEQYGIDTDVLSIGVYTENLSSMKPKSLKNSFSFFMQLKGSHEEIIISGSVQHHLELVTYERNIPPHAMLLLTFLPLEHELGVLLLFDEKPRGHMFEEAQAIPSSQDKSSLYLVNNSSSSGNAFLGIMSSSTVNFSFTMTVKVCSSWNDESLEWTSEHCSVGNLTNASHIHCSCWHLSLFGAKVFPTFGEIKMPAQLIENLPINYNMVDVVLIIVLVILAFLCLACQSYRWTSANQVILDDEIPDGEPSYQYQVTIYTHGHWHARTTSSVTIQLNGSLSQSPNYTIYSAPKNTVFYWNAQTSFTVNSPNDLGVLESVTLSLDGLGRYPKWKCHMVKIRDELKKVDYIFMVNTLLDEKSEMIVPLTEDEEFQDKKKLFWIVLENYFANYYVEENFRSAKMYDQLTAIEKTAILIMKLCIAFGGVSLYFGKTTIWNYEDERETYYFMLLELYEIILIAFVCHLVGVVFGEIFKFHFLRKRTDK